MSEVSICSCSRSLYLFKASVFLLAEHVSPSEHHIEYLMEEIQPESSSCFIDLDRSTEALG